MGAIGGWRSRFGPAGGEGSVPGGERWLIKGLLISAEGGAAAR